MKTNFPFIQLLAALVLVQVAFAAFHFGIPVGNLTRDIAAVAKVSPLTGVLSNLGILLWCATAATALFSATLLNRGVQRQFLLGFGLLTLCLLLDDFFMIHEHLAPNLGVRERYVLLAYLAATAGILFHFRTVILGGNYSTLLLALACFALSLAIDRVKVTSHWIYFAEDGFKFLGIVNWGIYVIRHSHFQVTAAGHGAKDPLRDARSAPGAGSGAQRHGEGMGAGGG